MTHPFRTAVEARDFDAMVAALSRDIVLHSPVTFSPCEGRAAVTALLRVVFEVFEDFTYTDELTSGPTTALVFTARVGGRRVQGVDLMRDAEDGSIADLTVIVRPYTGLRGYWPAVAANPEASPAVTNNPDLADLHREPGVRNNEIQKVVVSHSLTAGDTAPWTETTTVVRRADARREVAALKDQLGRDILMFGSRALWNDLLVAGFVDELYLMVGAAVLGGETPAFGAGPIPPLRLADIRRRDGSDNVLLRYEVVSGHE